MSVFIGNVKGPRHNSPNDVAQVWCSSGAVEFNVLNSGGAVDLGSKQLDASVSMDPISARTLAALLVCASEEADRMAARAAFQARTDDGERE